MIHLCSTCSAAICTVYDRIQHLYRSQMKYQSNTMYEFYVRYSESYINNNFHLFHMVYLLTYGRKSYHPTYYVTLHPLIYIHDFFVFK